MCLDPDQDLPQNLISSKCHLLCLTKVIEICPLMLGFFHNLLTIKQTNKHW